jgi:hypothetical protein
MPRRRFRLATGATAASLILLLAGMPAADAAQTAAPGSPALPQGDDLTLADGAGNVLIGLTVRPAQPGLNTVLVHVLPLEGAVAAADVSVSLVINGHPVPLDFCSRTCRTADVTLAGGEHVDVVADSPSGGTAGFDLPALPAPDGSTLLQQMQDQMHRLHTFRSDEILRPAATTPVETRYAFQAPDRMQMDFNTGSHTVFVGPTRYTRQDPPGTAWQAEDVGIVVPVPTFLWDQRSPTAAFVGAYILGTDNVDGSSTQMLAFFENLGQYPFWFRLWADAEGLVHRAEMRGQGHFMDDQYTDFDAPFSIEPPT